MRRHWPAFAAVGAYLLANLAIVAAGVVPISDEWIYIQGARQFAATASLDLSPLTLPNAIFEALYGSLAVLLAGDSFATFSLASVVLAAGGGVAFYDLVVRSGVTRFVAAAGTMAYLFGPLFFAINATFMTDGHAVNLAVISAAVLSRGIDRQQPMPSLIALGSAVAALAYLSRPASIAVIAGFGVVTIVRSQWAILPALLPIPLVVAGWHWYSQLLDGIPTARRMVLESLAAPSFEALGQSAKLFIFQTGSWMLPIAPLLAASLVAMSDRITWRVPLIAGVGMSALLVLSMPTIGDWVNPAGVFPIDAGTVGARPELTESSAMELVAIMAGLTLVAAVTLLTKARTGNRLPGAEAGLWAAGLASILLALVTVEASTGLMIDRYLLILMPGLLFSVMTRCSTHPPRWARAFTTGLVITIGLLSVLLTGDGFRTQVGVFDMAQAGLAAGLPDDEIDAGAAWTGLHLGHLVTPDKVKLPASGPLWWRELFAPGLHPSAVVVLGGPPSGCTTESMVIRRSVGPDVTIRLVSVGQLC